MRFRLRGVVLLGLLLLSLGLSACSGARSLFGRQYEYEEELYVALDGSATLVVNSSIAALLALRGLDLNPDPNARVDRDKVRAAYDSPVTDVSRVSREWRRNGRRFIQIRLDVPDVRRLSEAPAFAWSRYALSQATGEDGESMHVFKQQVGASAFKPGTLQNVGWSGNELVAFRLHLPSRIRWHNARVIETNETGEVERGNILRWEQALTDRLDGAPIEIEVRMDSDSILSRTLWLFAGAFLAAMAALAGLIWLMFRRGARQPDQPAGHS